jgi:hypothetical protein
MMASALRGVLVAVLGTFLSSLAFAATQSPQQLRLQQLRIAEAVLNKSPIPGTWRGGAFVSAQTIKELFALQAGSKLDIQRFAGFDQLEVELNEVRLKPQPEMMDVTLDLAVRSPKYSSDWSLVGEGLLAYRRTEVDGDSQRQHAVFGIHLEKVRPNVSLLNMRMTPPEFLSGVYASIFMAFLDKWLEFKIPLSPTIKLTVEPPTDGDKPRELTLPIKATGGSVTFAIEHKKIELPIKMNFALPVFTRNGVWLLADDGQFVPPIISATKSPTEKEIAALRTVVGTLLRERVVATAGADVVLFMHHRGFLEVVDQLRGLSPESKTVVLRSKRHTGRLYDAKWNDRVAGQGGLFLEPASGQFASGSITLQSVTGKWLPRTGMSLDATLSARGKIALHWHFDPLLGGGVGRNVAADAPSISAAVTGLLKMSMTQAEERSVILLHPDVACTHIPVDLKVRGDLDASVHTGFLFLERPLAPLVLVDTIPTRVEMPTEKQPLKSAKPLADHDGSKTSVRIVWRHPEVDIAVIPISASTTEAGFVAFAKASVSQPKLDKDTLKRAREAHTKALNQTLTTAHGQKCPRADDLRVTIAGMEIGPNGEIIKILKTVVDVAGRVKSEATKISKTPGKALADFPGNVAREAENVGKKIIDGIRSLGRKIGIGR